MKHPLINRTSPKGQPFLGTCASCGKENLSIDKLLTEDCLNPRNLSNEDAIREAVKGPE